MIAKFLYTNFPKQYGEASGILSHLLLPFKLFLFKLNFNIFFGEKGQDRWVVEDIFEQLPPKAWLSSNCKLDLK